MAKVRVPHDALVFVGDGRRALFLRNAGNPAAPNFRTERVFEQENPPTDEQGSDQPGRTFASVGSARSAVEQTDWHDLEEKRFAHDVAGKLANMVREGRVEKLVIAAPPRTLGELRQAMTDEVKSRVIAEIDKDFTTQPVPDIQKHFEGA